MQRGVFKRLETDVELLARTSAKAGHKVHGYCCMNFYGAEGADRTAERHQVVRRIVEDQQ